MVPIQLNFLQIEFDLFETGELLHVAVRLTSPTQARPLWSCRKGNCRREAARAGHILNDHIRIAGNVLRHMLGK